MNSILVSLLAGLIASGIIYMENSYNSNEEIDKSKYVKYLIMITLLSYGSIHIANNDAVVASIKKTPEILTGTPSF